jgi:hypothetical protein
VCVLQPAVPGSAVRYEPGHLQCSTHYHKTWQNNASESRISYFKRRGWQSQVAAE